MKKQSKIALISVIFFILLAIFSFITGAIFFIEIPLMMAFGWIGFLINVSPHITVNIAMILGGIVAILILLMGAHSFFSWFYSNYRTPSKDSPSVRPWKLGWTIAGVSIFVLMFFTSIAMTGFIHQVGWLSRGPIIENSWSHGETMREMRRIGAMLDLYHGDFSHFPITRGSIAIEKAGIPKEYFRGPYRDRWGSPYQYESDGQSYVLRSYGENRILGGGSGKFDDLVYADAEFIFPKKRY